uniref:Outer membrane receptor proteins, mostly Fe transport n=1 Tax=Candidatus Kentrum sp. FW TaxID=2126338 RepID=A0A450TFS2_9GAMM|nr:MAG: Outer membrane receptor proteins, mostly Fe transport [Candidatus Kentron sp. FW]
MMSSPGSAGLQAGFLGLLQKEPAWRPALPAGIAICRSIQWLMNIMFFSVPALPGLGSARQPLHTAQNIPGNTQSTREETIVKQKNTLLRNSLRLALLGAALAFGVPGIALADNVSIDTQQDENIPAGEQSERGGPIELDAISIIVEGEKIGRPLHETPAGTVVFGREADTPDNRRLQDVIKAIPNVLADPASSSLPSVRGIDGASNLHVNTSLMTGGQPRVNTLVDGVARPFRNSSLSSLSTAWDVEAVEVARGPQSTISGRNSFGGAVRVSTRDPVYEKEFALRAGYFNEPGTVEGALMANLPLVADQVALRFTAEGSDGESYVDMGFSPLMQVYYPDYYPGYEHRDDIEDEQFERYRGKLLFTPDALPDTELLLSIDHTKIFRAHQTKVDNVHADDLTNTSFGIGNWIDDNEQTVYSAELFQGLGETMELEVRVSYLDNTAKLPPGVTPALDLDYTTETTSAEALLRFEEWGFIDKGVVGVAYEYQEDWAINVNDILGFTMYGETDTYGIFGEIEAGLGGGFTAIVGGRFQTDDRDRRATSTANAGTTTSTGILRSNASNVGEDVFIPKLGIRYDGADKYVAGYTYSEGYRSEGIDFHYFTDTLPVTTFESERMNNHEIWVRANPLGRLRLDGSVFYYTADDMQIRGATSDSNCPDWPTGPCLTGNIPEAEGYGMELAAQWDINDAWRISGGLGLLETEITDAGSDVPKYQGQELNQAPNVTANMGLNWVSPRGFDAQVRARHVGSFRNHLDAESNPGDAIVNEYTLVDFKAGYETKIKGADVRIDAFVENLTDKRYALFTTAHAGSQKAAGRPRTFGIAVSARF